MVAALITMAEAATFEGAIVRRSSSGGAVATAYADAAPAMPATDLPPAAPATSVALGAAVVAAVAEAWSVPEGAIALDWSRAAGVDSNASVFHQLRHPGRDGWLVVRLGAGPGARSVVLRAGVRAPATFAARAVAAGATLEAADVRYETRVRWGAPGDAAAVPGAGWRARRSLAAGDPLAAPAIAPPALVRAGEAIALEWTSGTVRISMSGVALHAASAGDVVHVRVDGRPGRHAAVVTAPGRATLAGDRP
jgi:flagella basal body P-ring formation protein FlgA